MEKVAIPTISIIPDELGDSTGLICMSDQIATYSVSCKTEHDRLAFTELQEALRNGIQPIIGGYHIRFAIMKEQNEIESEP